jgi:hypothetical protein
MGLTRNSGPAARLVELDPAMSARAIMAYSIEKGVDRDIFLKVCLAIAELDMTSVG